MPESSPPETPLDPARKRLLFRAHHMGSNENDIFFGAFADDHITRLTDAQLASLETLMQVNDPDLFLWVTGAKPVPAEHDSEVMRLLSSYVLRQARR